MVDDTRVAAAFSRLALVGKVEDAAGGSAGGGGGEVGAGVGVAPRELVDWLPGSGDGLASGTGVLLRSTCREEVLVTLLPSESVKYKSKNQPW